MEALQRSFVSALPQRLSNLAALYQQWCESGQQSELLNELYRHSHNLAGAAALYEHDRVSNVVRELERYLRELIQQGEVGAEECAKVEVMLDAVKEAIDQIDS